jgi:hypothetical protein
MAAPVKARPPIEDAAKVAAIPHIRQARPVKGEGRKGKGKSATLESPPHPMKDCPNSNSELPILLCFCCPMMEFAHYQQLYVGKDFQSDTTPKTSDDKDIIQLHSEFTIRKMNGEAFTRRAQKDFPDGFHSDEELVVIIS